MSRNADVYAVPSLRIAITSGSIVKVGPFPGQLAASIKLLAGGTLEIGQIGASYAQGVFAGLTAVQGTATFSTGMTFGTMYPLSANEVFSLDSSGSYYLFASGADCTVAIASGRSAN